MKTCIFVIGDSDSGKSSVIRALTGCWRGGIRVLRTLSKKPIRILVVIGSLQEMVCKKFPPDKFLSELEKKFKIKRKDYDMIICALQVRLNSKKYSYDKYLMGAKNKGLKVKAAIIKDDNSKQVINFCKNNKIGCLELDLNKGYNEVAHEIRKKFYPK